MQHQHHFQQRANCENPFTPEDQRHVESVYRFQTDQVRAQKPQKSRLSICHSLWPQNTSRKTWYFSSRQTWHTGVSHIMLHQSHTSRFFHTGKPRAREALHASIATLPRDFYYTMHVMQKKKKKKEFISDGKDKANFIQSSGSPDLSETIPICWFGAQN